MSHLRPLLLPLSALRVSRQVGTDTDDEDFSPSPDRPYSCGVTNHTAKDHTQVVRLFQPTVIKDSR